jgi:hypothetical protein
MDKGNLRKQIIYVQLEKISSFFFWKKQYLPFRWHDGSGIDQFPSD